MGGEREREEGREREEWEEKDERKRNLTGVQGMEDLGSPPILIIMRADYDELLEQGSAQSHDPPTKGEPVWPWHPGPIHPSLALH